MTALFRQQSLLLGGRFKLNNIQLVLLIIALHISLAVNAFIFAFIELDLKDQHFLLSTVIPCHLSFNQCLHLQRYPGLAWISSHGFVWAAYAWNAGSFYFILSIFFQCVFIGSFAILVVRYTIMTVRRQRKIIAKRKDVRLTMKVRRIDTLVISQACCPSIQFTRIYHVISEIQVQVIWISMKLARNGY